MDKAKNNDELSKKTLKKYMRFSPNDMTIIKQKMNENHIISFTEFATNCMLNRSLTKPIRSELMTELHRIGNNLNQIAKKLNSKETLDNVALTIISDTFEIINDIYQELSK